MGNVINIRIHHFFDIIRDIGAAKDIKPHPYGHSYHKYFNLVKNNHLIFFKIVLSCDHICEGCSKKVNGHCQDKIYHRKDFKSKEKFNDFIDKKILEACFLKEGDIISFTDLLKKGNLYLKNIFNIYEGNELENTESRKHNVVNGIKSFEVI